MRPLPPKGLIVSCYLESMRGCEENFIAAVGNIPGVVALRVEGVENIKLARRMFPNMFIVGLMKASEQVHIGDVGSMTINGKEHKGHCKILAVSTKITPTVDWGKQIHEAGADMVATGCLLEWYRHGDLRPCIYGLGLHFRLMLDLSREMFKTIVVSEGGGMLRASLHSERLAKNIIYATTYEDADFDFVSGMKQMYPDAIVNMEGGLKTRDDIDKAFDFGADYVTIGKAINDPPTIIRDLLSGKERYCYG